MASNLNNPASNTRSRKRPRNPVKPQGVSKPLRRSIRPIALPGEIYKQQQSPLAKEVCRRVPPNRPLLSSQNRSTTPQPRKRSREPEEQSSAKRPRVSKDFASGPVDLEIPLGSTEARIDPIEYWIRNGSLPSERMSHLLAKRKSTPSLRKRSASGSFAASSRTPSDQKPREDKSAPYRDARYETLLAMKGSFMGKYKLGITSASKALYQMLLEKQQTIPEDSAFRDDLFEETCEMIRNKNEARVIRDISLFIVPSAEILAARGATTLKIMVESVNEGWNNSTPLVGTRPQPDYSVGFKREAFTEEQREKFAPFIGDFIAGNQSYFMATYYMYFPFLTCEVKCGAAALDIADRQNAHSMTLAVRAVVELFRLVDREKEIHREVLGFSISHDHRSVRIYGHYPVIDGSETSFYRHPIRTFDFTELDGKEKWTAYKFTKSVYDSWMPTHFKRLCSAIDDIPPGVNFDVPSQASGLS